MTISTGSYVMAFFLTVGAMQALFLACKLPLRRPTGLQSTWLWALLITLAFINLDSVLHELGYVLFIPHWANVSGPVMFLPGPLFYLYVRQFTHAPQLISNGWHFAPALLRLLTYVPFYVQGGLYKQHYLRQSFLIYPIEWHFDNYAALLTTLLYLLASFRLVYRANPIRLHRLTGWRVAQDNTAYPATGQWLWSCWAVLSICWGCWAYGQFRYQPDEMAAIGMLFAVLMYGLAYRGFQLQTDVFSPEPVSIQSTESLLLPATSPYQTSGFTPIRQQEAAERLRQLMQTDQLYRQADLSLDALAHHLALTPHHLSQLLNQTFNTSFYELLNQYRVAEVKRAIQDPTQQRFTLLALAMDAGFNSKATFNAAFKRHTGSTPSAFRRMMGTTPEQED